MEIDELRTLASRRIRAGQLPPYRPSRFFGGPGNGERCDVCDGRIGLASVAIEVERKGAPALTFHATCFRAWTESLAILRAASVVTVDRQDPAEDPGSSPHRAAPAEAREAR